jgi:pimeloyl-ACP methyl ester carboxylesterase
MKILARVVGSAAVLSLLLFPGSGVAAQPPSPAAIVLEPVTESGYAVSSVVPVGWKSLGPGLHARGSTATDPALIAIQSAQLAVKDVWSALLPQLKLTEAPKAIGDRDGATGLHWTLYHVESPTGVVVDIAFSEHTGGTYVVVLESPATEAAGLRDAVFLPAVDAFAPVTADASPGGSAAPVPYAEEEVTFTGGAASVTLAGTLTLPEGDGPFPAIVLVTGSGPQDRDESLAPLAAIKPFAIIADALSRAGVAVLRFDDRGTAKSTGDYSTATVTDFTADAAAAVAFLRTRTDVDQARVGLLGHSEGGLDVAEIAAADPSIAFVVGMAPPATNGVDLLIDQTEAILRANGTSDAEITASIKFARDTYQHVLAGDNPGAEQVIRDYAGALYDRQSADAQKQLGDRTAYVQSQVDARMTTLFSPWFVSLLKSDAGAAWAKVHAPVLGLFGGKDVQVPALTQAPALTAALQAAGDTDVTVTTIPDANHLFQSARTGSVGEYGSLAQTFTPDFLPTLVDWVTARAGVAR